MMGILNARLSTVGPGTHITAHCGISNAKLRLHLPLQVPTLGTVVQRRDDGDDGDSTATNADGGRTPARATCEPRLDASAFRTKLLRQRWGRGAGGRTTSGSGQSEVVSGLRVGDTFVRWCEGRVLVFDDSFEHEVWWGLSLIHI